MDLTSQPPCLLFKLTIPKVGEAEEDPSKTNSSPGRETGSEAPQRPSALQRVFPSVFAAPVRFFTPNKCLPYPLTLSAVLCGVCGVSTFTYLAEKINQFKTLGPEEESTLIVL